MCPKWDTWRCCDRAGLLRAFFRGINFWIVVLFVSLLAIPNLASECNKEAERLPVANMERITIVDPPHYEIVPTTPARIGLDSLTSQCEWSVRNSIWRQHFRYGIGRNNHWLISAAFLEFIKQEFVLHVSHLLCTELLRSPQGLGFHYDVSSYSLADVFRIDAARESRGELRVGLRDHHGFYWFDLHPSTFVNTERFNALTKGVLGGIRRTLGSIGSISNRIGLTLDFLVRAVRYSGVDSCGNKRPDGSHAENPLHEKRAILVMAFILCIGGAFSSLYALWCIQNGPHFWRWAILAIASLALFACGVFMLLDRVGQTAQLCEESVAHRYEPLGDDVHENDPAVTGPWLIGARVSFASDQRLANSNIMKGGVFSNRRMSLKEA